MRWLILLLLLAGTAQASTETVGTAQRWRALSQELQGLEPGRSFPYQHCFRRAAERHALPLALLLAVARGESDFNPRAVSSADALGLMQIRWPVTARHLGIQRKERLFDPCTNVDAGARYLKELLQRYGGDPHLSLAAYNYGPGRITPGVRSIPKGAAWYSAYILRHLDYVLNGSGNYDQEGRLDLIRFARPYRAQALADSLTGRYPKLRLTVFRRPAGDFRVVLLFENGDERKQGLKLLASAGIRPI